MIMLRALQKAEHECHDKVKAMIAAEMTIVLTGNLPHEEKCQGDLETRSINRVGSIKSDRSFISGFNDRKTVAGAYTCRLRPVLCFPLFYGKINTSEMNKL